MDAFTEFRGEKYHDGSHLVTSVNRDIWRRPCARATLAGRVLYQEDGLAVDEKTRADLVLCEASRRAGVKNNGSAYSCVTRLCHISRAVAHRTRDSRAGGASGLDHYAAGI